MDRLSYKIVNVVNLNTGNLKVEIYIKNSNKKFSILIKFEK